MKTLLVDNNPAMLRHCIARIGVRQPLTIATSKAQALALMRYGNPFEVVVACERLEDGSGLALLDAVRAEWPGVLRVFCADRLRLAVVRKSMSALRLRHTLSYPIRPLMLESMLVNLALKPRATAANRRSRP